MRAVVVAQAVQTSLIPSKVAMAVPVVAEAAVFI